MSTIINTESRISDACVYSDRVMITRTAEVKLEKAGEYEIRFEKLPAHILQETVRASGLGVEGTKILGVDIKLEYYTETPKEKVLELEKVLEHLQIQEKELLSKLEILKKQQSFLDELDTNSHQTIPRYWALQKLELNDIQELYDFLFNKLGNLNHQGIELRLEQKKLKAEMLKVQKELNIIRSPQELETYTIIVGVEVAKSGKLELNIHYGMYYATWHPHYDVRVFVEEKNVELTYYGMVSQQTGEDWTATKLALSTARPSVGARLPYLSPWYLNIYIPPVYEKTTRRSKGRKEDTSEILMEEKTKALFKDIDVDDIITPPPAPKKLAQLTAEVESAGTSFVFNIPKLTDIPSDNTPHKTTIGIESFPCELDYVTVPKLSSFAYLRAKITNQTTYQLLPGDVNVFQNTDYVGTSSIDSIAPTEEFEVFLGIDERIKVERKLEEKDTAKKGWLKDKKALSYEYKIIIQNFLEKEANIIVIDQLPISQNEEIKVELDEESLEPKEIDKQGIMKWEKTLKPQEKWEIIFHFTIAYPKDKTISGL